MNTTILRDRFVLSLSVDDLADKIELAGKSIAGDAAILRNYPSDENARLSIREAARTVLWAADILERISR